MVFGKRIVFFLLFMSLLPDCFAQYINPAGKWIGTRGDQVTITVIQQGIMITDQLGQSQTLYSAGLNQYSNLQTGFACIVGGSSTLMLGHTSGVMESFSKLAEVPVTRESAQMPQQTVTQRQLTVSSMGNLAKSFAQNKIQGPANETVANEHVENSGPVNPSDVDLDIPETRQENEETFALVVGNENYTNEIKVSYAKNDATIFADYCHKTLGIPKTNIRLITDATLGQILFQVQWIQDAIKAYKGEAKVIVYYAGHGMPDEKDKSAYLLPVDGSAGIPATALKQSELYASLTAFPARSVTVFLDACFSGGARDGMLTKGRGIAIKPVETPLRGNLVVFTATSQEETALPFEEKHHGLFTYFLLKEIRESKGNISLQDLTDSVSDKVEKQSVVVNGKAQNPKVNVSQGLDNTWKQIKLR